MTVACGGRPAPAASAPATAEIPPPQPRAGVESPPAPPEFVVTKEHELLTPTPVSFRVRPLAGPGSIGPSELTPDSAEALQHVVAYLREHPTEQLRIECAVNGFKMSSGPNVGRGTHLAHLVARALVERGIACERLHPSGVLERARDAPAERVRFVVGRNPRDPLDSGDADSCSQ